jgi:hypothetical protein
MIGRLFTGNLIEPETTLGLDLELDKKYLNHINLSARHWNLL